MKNFKKFAAMVSAMALAACAVAPVAVSAAVKNDYATPPTIADLNEAGQTAFSTWKSENTKADEDFSEWLTAVEVEDDYFNEVTPVVHANSYSITIKTTEADHAYSAYQIFSATSIGSDNVLGGIAWSDSMQMTVEGTSIYDALKALNIEKNSKNIFAKSDDPTSALTSAQDVAKALSGVATNNALVRADIDDIANVFAKYIKANATAIPSGTYNNDLDGEGELTAGADGNTGYVISISNPGYYLVIDNDATESPDNPLKDGEALSRYILQVAGRAVVITKSSVPSVMKKVKENVKTVSGSANMGCITETEAWNDVADYSIGDSVPFKLYGSMPASIDDYEHYKYIFHDTLGTGLALPDNPSFTVKITNKGVSSAANTEHTVDPDCYVLTTSGLSDSCTFELSFTDIKAAKVDDKTANSKTGAAITINSDSVVTVEYDALLTSDAIIGLNGQENTVKLEYTNNPRYDGGGGNDETSKTSPDTVIVFTYELDVTKYLGPKSDKNKADATDGTKAGFKLKATTGTHKNKWATINIENGKVTGWVDSEDEATQVETSSAGQFKFVGLDDGTYLLTETLVPAGYNQMENLSLIVKSTTVNNQQYKDIKAYDSAGKVLTALELYKTSIESVNKLNTAGTTGNNANGIVKTDIENQKGNSLPGTGGIGTTIFYLGGGAMVAVAGVFLITKKRMGKKEN